MNKLTIIAIIIFIIAAALLLLFGLTPGTKDTFKESAGFEQTPLMKEHKLPNPMVAQYSSYDGKYHLEVFNYTQDFYQECLKDPDKSVDTDIVKVADKNGKRYIVEVKGASQSAYMLDDFLKVNNMQSVSVWLHLFFSLFLYVKYILHYGDYLSNALSQYIL